MSPKKRCTVLDRSMAYVEEGSGDPIVFLHGNPTSSLLWRKVMPHLEGFGRLLAPDLLGHGDSDKLPVSGPDSYRFIEHRRYLDELLARLEVRDRVVLVIHDWGSALGFDWARRHPDAVQGIAFMEAIVRPLAWDEWPEASRSVFEGFRSPAGEKMVLEKNVFVEKVLPGSILRTLTDEEMRAYRRPFAKPGEDRRPTLTWPREIPIDGVPADVHEIVSAYSQWLTAPESPPKLFVNAEPGAILTGKLRAFARTMTHLEEVTVKGIHFVQEDSPDEIGQAVRAFVQRLRTESGEDG
ncbi:MAG: haloalkane dehalogenase [Myxococcota bacterium]